MRSCILSISRFSVQVPRNLMFRVPLTFSSRHQNNSNSKMVYTNRSSVNYEFIATKFMLGFFKVLGLAPFGVQKSSGPKLWKKGPWQSSAHIQCVSSLIGCFYNLFLVPLQFRMLFIAWPLEYTFDFPDRSSITQTISKFESVLHNTVLFAIWLILGLRQKTAIRLLNRLLSFDGANFYRDEDHFSESCRCFFTIVFLTHILVWTGLLFTEQWTYHALVLTWFGVIVPTFVLTWFVIQYVFVVKLIEKRFSALNRALLMNSVTASLGFERHLSHARDAVTYDSYGPKIKTISRAHTNLYEIAIEISDFYSVPILLTIAFASYTTLYVSYYITVPLFNDVDEQAFWIIANCIFWLIAVMLPVAMLSSGVTNVTKEMTNTADVIRMVLNRSTTSPRDILELKEFAIELLHRKIEFTACGFFPLDCTLLHSIFTMVVGYLIILIQFQLASRRHNSHDATHNTTITESSSFQDYQQSTNGLL